MPVPAGARFRTLARLPPPPPQGFSTGLPERLQLALLRSLPGLEACTLLRPAYAGGAGVGWGGVG